MPEDTGTATGAGDRRDRNRGRSGGRNDSRKDRGNKTPTVVLRKFSVNGPKTSTAVYLETWQGSRVKPGISVQFLVGDENRPNQAPLSDRNTPIVRVSNEHGVVQFRFNRSTLPSQYTHIRARTHDGVTTEPIPFPEDDSSPDYVVGAVNRITISPTPKAGRIVFPDFEGTLIVRTFDERGNPSGEQPFDLSFSDEVYIYAAGEPMPASKVKDFDGETSEHGFVKLKVCFFSDEIVVTLNTSTGHSLKFTLAAY